MYKVTLTELEILTHEENGNTYVVGHRYVREETYRGEVITLGGDLIYIDEQPIRISERTTVKVKKEGRL
jgi:hypothetical protein